MRWTNRRTTALAAAALCVALVGCAASPELTTSTPSRLYQAPSDRVFTAAVAAFGHLGLEVFQKNEATGYVEGGRKPGFARGSETVGVWIKPAGANETRVSVDTQKALAGRMFAVDWTDQIFGEIQRELTP